MAEPWTFLGIDPKAAIRKLSGDASADVVPTIDAGGRFNPGNVIGRIDTVALGSQNTPVRRSEPSTVVDDERAPGVPTFNRDGMDNGSTTTTTPDPAAQAAARAQALANPLYKALAGLDTTLANSKADNQGEYQRMMQEYNAANAADREAYDNQVSSNESGYAGQQQNKMLSGARLNRNLMSVLASMGALNGTGAFLGSEAVRNITNSGLGEAKDNFIENSTGINTAWEKAEREQRQRENDAETLLKDKNSAAEADVLTKRQQILNQLATIFGADTAKGGQYLSEAGALYGDIARTTRPNVGKYAAADSKYSAASLKDYLNGFGDTQIAARPANPGENVPINSPLYADTRRKDKQLV